ncbi:MAG: aldo/keto reductase [Archangiaceae bacterium]|nr:aldo/keto reductase [Archangiaceae bacterium]
MNFGKRTAEPEARRIVERALDAGLTAFDTANLYNEGLSEQVLGRALGARRESVTITTKVGAWKKEGLGAARVVASLDESLARLKTDFVDVYLLHVPDHATPLEQTLEGLSTVLESKKARAWGVSNFAAWQLGELNHLCDARGLPKPVQSQVLYNLAIRQLDLEYFAFTRRFPIQTVIYNPLAGGLLAREPSAPVPKSARLETNGLYRKRDGSETMRGFAMKCAALASQAGLSLFQLSLAWVAQREGVDVVLLGPASEAQLTESIDAAAKALPANLLAAIDTAHREFTGTDASYAR